MMALSQAGRECEMMFVGSSLLGLGRRGGRGIRHHGAAAQPRRHSRRHDLGGRAAAKAAGHVLRHLCARGADVRNANRSPNASTLRLRPDRSARARSPSGRAEPGGLIAARLRSSLRKAGALRPAGHARLQDRHQPVHDDALDRERDQAGEDQRHLELRLRLQHQIADAVVRGDAFGNHRADEGQRDRDLQRAEEIGQRARDADLAHDVELGGAERLERRRSQP